VTDRTAPDACRAYRIRNAARLDSPAGCAYIESSAMYDRRFFRSKLGRAALLSILAMLAVNVVALQTQLRDGAARAAVAGPEQA
jgi:hypothetical protein